MSTRSSRSRAIEDTRKRILDVALDALGANPEAAMAEIAVAAGVVRRTVYGYYPTRLDLVKALTRQAVDELHAILETITDSTADPALRWARFVAHLWPLVQRYRIIVTLRRGEFSRDIHAILAPVDQALAALVQEGQDAEIFSRYLPAPVLSKMAFSAVYTVADSSLAGSTISANAVVISNLMILGVPGNRAATLIAH